MSYYDSEDPWGELLDPETSQRFRAALDQTFQSHMQPFKDAEEDRKLAQDDARLHKIHGAAWDRQRLAVLDFAVANELGNLEHAFHAYRGSQNADSTAQPIARESDGRFAPEKAQPVKGWSRNDEYAARDAGDAALEKELRQANEASGNGYRNRQIAEINASRAHRNDQRTTRAILGHPEEKAPAKSRDERRAEMDLEAEDMVRADNEANSGNHFGNTAPPMPSVGD